MRKLIYLGLVIFIITSDLSTTFGEYDPVAQIGLPEGAIARIGKGAISKVAYSPDGTRLAVGSSIGVWIYDIESGKALDLFPMYGVSCLAFSPDGKTLVCGNKRHHLTLWDMTTGEPLHTFNSDYQYEVYSVAFNPDGKTLVSGHDYGLICLFDTETGKSSRYFFNIWGEEGSLLVPYHVGKIRGLAYSPDGKTLVSICDGDSDAVHLWEATTGKYIRLLYSVGGEMDSVESISFSPDGHTLAIGFATGWIGLWDTMKTDATPKYFDDQDQHRWDVFSLAFSPDGNMLASCGRDSNRDNTVRLWDMKTRKLLRTFEGHKDGVFSVVFSPDGKTIASSSKEAVRLWNTQGEKHLRSVISHTAILGVAYSPDGKTLASGNEDNTVRLWDAITGKPITTLSGHEGEVSNVVFSPNGKTLASIGNDTVRLWDTKTGEPLRTLSESENSRLTFSPDGETLVTEHLGGTVRLWNTRIGERRHTFTKQKHFVDGIVFSPDGQTHALLRDEGYNRSLWDIKADKLVCSLTVPATKRHQLGVAFSPDGSMLSTGMVDMAPSGERQDTVWLWDTTTGEHIRTLTGHLNTIRCVAFSPDGQLLASGSEDETVLIWDLKNGKHPYILIGHNDEVTNVKFSPDGKTLASNCKDGTVLLWDLDKISINTEDRNGK